MSRASQPKGRRADSVRFTNSPITRDHGVKSNSGGVPLSTSEGRLDAAMPSGSGRCGATFYRVNC